MTPKLLSFSILFIFHFSAFAQKTVNNQDYIIYKKVDTTPLKMKVLYPDSLKENKLYPCVVFFFGGGWKTGNLNQFTNQAKHFNQKGMICFLVDYRVQSRQGTMPFESLKDAKSAIRFIRENAMQFQIDKDAVVASGGSAGGHLAAATALIDSFNENTDDFSVSAKPNALMLFNPVIDNGPGGYGFERIGDAYKIFSPLHNIQKGAPPTIIFLGTKDNLIPVQTVQYYKTVMEKVGSRCDVFLYEGATHGFFNKQIYLEKTLAEADTFLQSLGFIK
jgi:acetyl esterase/lipase